MDEVLVFLAQAAQVTTNPQPICLGVQLLGRLSPPIQRRWGERSHSRVPVNLLSSGMYLAALFLPSVLVAARGTQSVGTSLRTHVLTDYKGTRQFWARREPTVTRSTWMLLTRTQSRQNRELKFR